MKLAPCNNFQTSAWNLSKGRKATFHCSVAGSTTEAISEMQTASSHVHVQTDVAKASKLLGRATSSKRGKDSKAECMKLQTMTGTYFFWGPLLRSQSISSSEPVLGSLALVFSNMFRLIDTSDFLPDFGGAASASGADTFAIGNDVI